MGPRRRPRAMADEKDAGLLWRSNDHVIAYKRFMHDLSAHLTTNNIDELKYLVNLPTGESQNVHTGLQLLGALENHGLISPQNGGMSLLTELFQLIHRNDLSRKIVSFEKGREAPPNKKLDPIEMKAAQKAAKQQMTHTSLGKQTKPSPFTKPGKEVKTPKLQPPSAFMSKKNTATTNEYAAPTQVKRKGGNVPHENMAPSSEEAGANSPGSSGEHKGMNSASVHSSREAEINSPGTPNMSKGTSKLCSNSPQEAGDTSPLSPEVRKDKMYALPKMSSKIEDERVDIPSKLEYAIAGQTDDRYYPMMREPRGYCVIISNEDFSKTRNKNSDDGLLDRRGSSMDVTNLETLFTSLKFDVRTYRNKEAAEMQNIMDEFAAQDHSEYDCFVACLLSHGCDAGVYGNDGIVLDMNSILHPFKNSISLKEKPKVFFCQFCRGEREEKVYSDSAEQVPSFRPSDHPVEADFYIGCASPPGYVSWRSEKHGSWYVSKLCEVLKEEADKSDLKSIMTRVAGEVGKAYTSDGYKQMPHESATLTKLLKFL